MNDCFLIPLDLEFVKTFLYTYQSFSTPERLLKKLIERYNVVRPSGMPLKTFSTMKQTIQARVINAFKLWVDLSADFKGNCVNNKHGYLLKARHLGGADFCSFYRLGVPEQAPDGIPRGFAIVVEDKPSGLSWRR